MEYFWAVIVSLIVIMILYGIVSSKINSHRVKKAAEKVFPNVADHLQADRRYNILLSHGKTLKNAKFLGISPPSDQHNPYLPFYSSQWLIVEKENGKKAYLKPDTVKYYEDADEEGKMCQSKNE